MSYINKFKQSTKVVVASGLVALTLTANAAEDRPLTHQELDSILGSFVVKGKEHFPILSIKFSDLLGRPVWCSGIDITGDTEIDITLFFEIDANPGARPISVFFNNRDHEWDTTKGDLYYFLDDGLYRRGYVNENIKDI